MKHSEARANLLLLLAALVWGFAFVAQRVGAEYLQAFTFNGLRFLLGAVSLLPLILLRRRGQANTQPLLSALPAGLLAGSVLFIASSLQQIGMGSTTAGKAGFITGLYVVLVPVAGIFIGRRTGALTWVSVGLAAVGLYFISVTGSFTVSRGDLFEIASAFFWTAHILIIDRLAVRTDPIGLSFFQFLTCSVMSLTSALIFEKISLSGIAGAAIPILYGGIFSVGVAYTLQIIGQRHAKPAHSAVILSMESAFAALGGFLILRENLGLRTYFGCALMIAGMLLSQLSGLLKRPAAAQTNTPDPGEAENS